MYYREFLTKSPQETIYVGRILGSHLKGGESILLTGGLGTGKTVFTKGIALSLGIDPDTPVVSPSFTLVNVYKARLDIVHVDLYRLDVNEVWTIGLEDYMDDKHVIIVEWGGALSEILPQPVIDVQLVYAGQGERKIFIKGDIDILSDNGQSG